MARKRRRRFVFALIAFAFVYVIVELGSVVAWWAATGECFTWGRAKDARTVALADTGGASSGSMGREQAVQRTANLRTTQHPYLGFVTERPENPDPNLPISPYGFHGTGPLKKRGPNTYVVGIVGGSVALHFSLHAEHGFREALLRSPALAGRDIEFVNLAVGGYKQPQQLLALQLMLALGGEFDALVNLDGFNEVALVRENVPLGVPSWYPRSWARMLDAQPSPDQLRRIGQLGLLAEQRRQRAESAAGWSLSPMLQFLWLWGDRDLASRIGELRVAIERADAAPSPAVVGPGTEGRDVGEARRFMVDLWQRASRQLHALCESHGIAYFHFLQPNQYVPDSKPIGPAEAKVALRPELPWREGVHDGYPLLRAAGKKLAEDGIAFTDLTNVFVDHDEPLYVDSCCHMGQQGNAILGEVVAARMRTRLDLDGVEIVRFRVEPGRLELGSPLAGVRLTVTGIDAAGRPHDLSGAGFGTRSRVDPAGFAEVSADGVVRPLRRGEATLYLEREGKEFSVPMVSSWPDVLVCEDALGEAGAKASLRLMVDEVPAGAGVVKARFADLPAAAYRLIVVGERRLPDSPIRAETFGLTVLPTVAPGTSGDLDVPIPTASGKPVFVRVYALDERATTVVGATNTVVITRS